MKNILIYMYSIIIVAICTYVPFQSVGRSTASNYPNVYLGYFTIFNPPAPAYKHLYVEILYGYIILEILAATAIAGLVYTFIKSRKE